MNRVILLVLIIAGLSSVEPHGYVRVPLARTSIFRDPSFGAQMPFWWNDTGVMCGDVVQDLQYSRCGRCGDTLGQTFANQGGVYDKGIITGTYSAGQVCNYLTKKNLFCSCVTLSFSQLDHQRHSRIDCQPSWSRRI